MFRDYISLLRTLTFKRFFNGVKVAVSFYLSRLLRKTIHWGMPMSLSVEPTNICNLKCPECPTGMKILTRRSGTLHPELFRKIIDQVYPTTPYLTLYFQGEPYLNPDFFNFVNYARKKKMYFTTSTNGHFLNEANCEKTVSSGLSKLIISVDGTTQDVYQQYRVGGDLQTVIRGIKCLMETKKKMNSLYPFVVLQFIVFRQNEHQIDEIRRIARETGVDFLALKTAQVYDYESGKNIIPENIKYSRYRKTKDGTYIIQNKYYNHCWRSWQSCVMTWDGHIVPCCFDKDARYKAGSVLEKPFREIWHNESLNSFRQNILKARKNIDICTNCTEGTKIWI